MFSATSPPPLAQHQQLRHGLPYALYIPFDELGQCPVRGRELVFGGLYLEDVAVGDGHEDGLFVGEIVVYAHTRKSAGSGQFGDGRPFVVLGDEYGKAVSQYLVAVGLHDATKLRKNRETLRAIAEQIV